MPTSRLNRTVCACLLAIGLVGCSEDSQIGNGVPLNCDIASQNAFVYGELLDSYFWADFVRDDANPADFASPSATLQALKFEQDETRFGGSYSFVADQAEFTSLLEDGQFVGFGVRLAFDDAERLYAILVFAGSPAAQAGLVRGDQIIRIDGSVPTRNNLDSLLGPSQEGVSVDMEIQGPNDSASQVVTVTKRTVTIDSTQVVRTLDVNASTTVGYLLFTNFFAQVSRDALRDAFGQFRQQGVDRLILDLRYNGGGSVVTSTVLASLIASPTLAGEILTNAVANDDNPNLGFTERFVSEANALGLSEVVVITSDATASASELVINGLAPFLNVRVVGDTTFGKPVGQRPMNFCDKTLAAVNFQTLNADGEGDYFNGIAADCPAADQWTRPLDLVGATGNEASIQTALNLIAGQPCSSAKAFVAAPMVDAYASGMRALVGAH